MTFDKQSFIFLFFLPLTANSIVAAAVQSSLLTTTTTILYHILCFSDDDYNGFLTRDVPACSVCIGKFSPQTSRRRRIRVHPSTPAPRLYQCPERAKELFKNSERRRSAPGPSDLLFFFSGRIEIKNGNNCRRNEKKVLLSLLL